jgi:colanic acid biosynthesis protein WcaH
MKLNKEEFIERVRLSPLTSIDLIVKNQKGEVLLGLRKNNPAKNKWFIPGGCIIKNETLDSAFNRITLSEIGYKLEREDASFFSIGEHFYKENAFDMEGIDTHYIVITYVVYLLNESLKEDDQHFIFKWMSVAELLNREDVHEHTKILFK